MEAQTCLSDPTALVIIDTSTAINLSATGFAGEILQALPNRAVVIDVVSAELEKGRTHGRHDADLLKELVASDLIQIKLLGESAEEIFENLVIGIAAETLDDGEAATIAYAVTQDEIAIIDERKANRICKEKFPSLRLGSTLDLIAHPDVIKTLGQQRVSQVLLNALQNARMRVLPHHVEWVIERIGVKQAALCTSLPRSVRELQKI